MKYLVVFSIADGKTMDDVAPLMLEEVKEVWRSYQSGPLREFYFSPKQPAVILVYEAPDEETLEETVGRLPMVREHVLDHQVFELGAFDNLQILFDKTLAS
ncbi:hypothetical protein Q0601_23215 [Paracoccus onubensis]|uniref:hypothetical protein n=1 Tax=Paracoccus onubensis TaxID=1675788 RepID=UPI002731965A|nr:hypothetical protein [Paracoccus onubensis]MDP0930095.1 hypothetical protein [Paracoccus onubensis]